MTRRATIAALRADLDAMQRDMWLLAEESDFQKVENQRLRAIVDRQDETILVLWGLLDAGAEGPEQQADEAPFDTPRIAKEKP